MGLLFVCKSCQKEMVLESYHRGREVPCPWCGERDTVPESLDFEHVYAARAKDESSGRTLLVLSVVSAMLCCAPIAAIVWWQSHGRIVAAREDQREADAMLLNARVISAVATLISCAVVAMSLLSYLSR